VDIEAEYQAAANVRYPASDVEYATDIHVLVNGNLHREQEENKRLRALLEQHGIDSDSGQTNNS
jgi:hypothetical protein